MNKDENDLQEKIKNGIKEGKIQNWENISDKMVRQHLEAIHCTCNYEICRCAIIVEEKGREVELTLDADEIRLYHRSKKQGCGHYEVSAESVSVEMDGYTANDALIYFHNKGEITSIMKATELPPFIGMKLCAVGLWWNQWKKTLYERGKASL